jgi:hypothetical protein
MSAGIRCWRAIDQAAKIQDAAHLWIEAPMIFHMTIAE